MESVPVTVIKPTTGWVPLNLKELWRHRELLYFLVWRDLKVRYKQTVLGVGWAILQPLLTMIIFTIFFGKLARIPSEGVPYPIFAFTALVPWTFFAHALSQASRSVVDQQHIITKVYFPRLLLPLSSILSGLVDFSVAFLVLIGMMFFFKIPPTPLLWITPLLVLAIILTALSVGLWLSALNVEYRDIKYVVPFLTQVWLFLSPVVYPSSMVPEKWRLLYGLNPMAGVIEGFRFVLLGKGTLYPPMLWASFSVIGVLLIGGLYYFRRMEKTFADII